MQAVIIDDEVHNVDNLIALLARYCPQVMVAGHAGNADDGAELILSVKPDIVFLDIQMPGKNGFEMLKMLPSHHFELVFVTGFDQYGIQAIRFSALDYIMKPIDPQELQTAVQRAQQKIDQKMQNVQVKNLMDLLVTSRQRSEHRIGLSSAKETRFVKVSQIVRCQAENNYTIFFLDGGEQMLVSRPMFEYDEMLSGYGFLRPHNSHLVNQTYIKSLIKEDSGYLVMEDGARIPVSRLKKDIVKKALSG
ncbi:LytTR family DNA-binding domain-containing protein [Dyadobacter sp. Leaf189]|uniref:LytR/AlgR family response regulator transcription factor n=1 Tax=Dyadobacter sp. Leaf189 TaxID=1736295 RepID=UPI0006F86BF3|nr:LytTR family DNA-binding domain-containing protein [Dyadobacter sp. Leaf189]KQS30715.1 two-component system response regulator [Dyadobacter sp. Leaf189]